MTLFIKINKMVKDIAGQRFGRLVAIGPVGRDSAQSITWLCKCDCGEEKVVSGNVLRRGATVSCGCYHREATSSRYKNLAGERFGSLVVQKISGKHKDGGYIWECICDCGSKVTKRSTTLVQGHAKSCGCVKKDPKKHSSYKHGYSRTVEHKAWYSMIHRCVNRRNKNYDNYGGRGIKVCKEWINSFETFLQDMGKKPTNKHSLERIDNEKGYCKENCKWVPWETQANNRRGNHLLTVNGVTMTIAQWARKSGNKPYLISQRIHRGWTPEDAIFKKPKSIKNP